MPRYGSGSNQNAGVPDVRDISPPLSIEYNWNSEIEDDSDQSDHGFIARLHHITPLGLTNGNEFAPRPAIDEREIFYEIDLRDPVEDPAPRSQSGPASLLRYNGVDEYNINVQGSRGTERLARLIRGRRILDEPTRYFVAVLRVRQMSLASALEQGNLSLAQHWCERLDQDIEDFLEEHTQ